MWDRDIEKLVEEIITAYPKEVALYRGGHKNWIAFFAGRVNTLSEGHIGHLQAMDIFVKRLKEDR
jgi:Asp-tRNA(Asn)/Glu-tRNA(Gln) amidotransferase B subunit